MNVNVTQELKLMVPAEKKERFCDLLLTLGLSGFVEGSIDCDIPFEYGDKHLDHDYYLDHKSGHEPLIFYSNSKEELETTLTYIRNALSDGGLSESDLNVTWSEINENDWKESWKESFRPILIGDDLVVLPPWENKLSYLGKAIVEINPGMAFGTGQHETTKLCLELYLDSTPRIFQRVFDVGTGSGILAIAARLLGCQDILGCDIDHDSVRIAIENARVNNCADIRFTAEKLENIEERNFDLIFANIQARPLSIILPDILSRSSNDYTLIISGVLVDELEAFTKRLADLGAAPILQKRMGDWMGLIVKPLASLV